MDDFERNFAQLVARYVATLPPLLEELAHRLHQTDTGDQQALHDALALAHRLHGTTGSYQLHSLREPLRRLEQRLDDVVQGHATWDAVSEGAKDDLRDVRAALQQAL